MDKRRNPFAEDMPKRVNPFAEEAAQPGLTLVSSRDRQSDEFAYKIPAGNYVAEVVDSDIVNRGSPFGERIADLLLMVRCRNQRGVYKTTLKFRVHDPDEEAQTRERKKVARLAIDMGIRHSFNDSVDLHGKSFRLTMWSDPKEPVRFSCNRQTGECNASRR